MEWYVDKQRLEIFCRRTSVIEQADHRIRKVETCTHSDEVARAPYSKWGATLRWEIPENHAR